MKRVFEAGSGSDSFSLQIKNVILFSLLNFNTGVEIRTFNSLIVLKCFTHRLLSELHLYRFK